MRACLTHGDGTANENGSAPIPGRATGIAGASRCLHRHVGGGGSAVHRAHGRVRTRPRPASGIKPGFCDRRQDARWIQELNGTCRKCDARSAPGTPGPPPTSGLARGDLGSPGSARAREPRQHVGNFHRPDAGKSGSTMPGPACLPQALTHTPSGFMVPTTPQKHLRKFLPSEPAIPAVEWSNHAQHRHGPGSARQGRDRVMLPAPARCSDARSDGWPVPSAGYRPEAPRPRRAARSARPGHPSR